MSFTNAEKEKRPVRGAYSRAAVDDRIVIAHSQRCPAVSSGIRNIDRVARAMIRRHGSGAARAAAERLNTMIDRGNGPGRDLWVCVVHAIHEHQDDDDEGDGGSTPHLSTRFDLLCLPTRLTRAWGRPGGT